MKINSVSEMTGNASLMLFFATDAVSALTGLVIRVTPNETGNSATRNAEEQETSSSSWTIFELFLFW